MSVGSDWSPVGVRLVREIRQTSTKPLFVVTHDGNAVVKYMGNAAGCDALVSELLCARLAQVVNLPMPRFSVCNILEISVDAHISTRPGPAFFSEFLDKCQDLSADLVSKIHNVEDLSKLVVFDTWVKNSDRYFFNSDMNYLTEKPENLLLRQDGKKFRLYAIDHTHVFTDEALDSANFTEQWAQSRDLYGLFPMFLPHLRMLDLEAACQTIACVDERVLESICADVPREWGVSSHLLQLIATRLIERGRNLPNWVPDAVSHQMGQLRV